jgi:hypothetical protein
VRRFVAWVSGAVGGIVAYRLVRRRAVAAREAGQEAPPDSDARVEQLRAKLAETRAAEPVVEEPPAEPVVEEPPAAEAAADPGLEPGPSGTPEERRRRVHEEGRATLDEMQSE